MVQFCYWCFYFSRSLLYFSLFTLSERNTFVCGDDSLNNAGMKVTWSNMYVCFLVLSRVVFFVLFSSCCSFLYSFTFPYSSLVSSPSSFLLFSLFPFFFIPFLSSIFLPAHFSSWAPPPRLLFFSSSYFFLALFLILHCPDPLACAFRAWKKGEDTSVGWARDLLPEMLGRRWFW